MGCLLTKPTYKPNASHRARLATEDSEPEGTPNVSRFHAWIVRPKPGTSGRGNLATAKWNASSGQGSLSLESRRPAWPAPSAVASDEGVHGETRVSPMRLTSSRPCPAF